MVYFGQSRKSNITKLCFYNDAYVKTHGAECLAGITNNQFWKKNPLKWLSTSHTTWTQPEISWIHAAEGGSFKCSEEQVITGDRKQLWSWQKDSISPAAEVPEKTPSSLPTFSSCSSVMNNSCTICTVTCQLKVQREGTAVRH